ncbi:MAG TPA: rod shape-determining protein MreC [Terriglobales bacterium]|nr:rod shape-determining protein MreC [Terriglobales bacterium]
MDTFLTRYRNVTILVIVLFLQVIGLAVQVRRSSDNESSRLIRVWAVSAVSPLERGIVGLQRGMANLWHNYIYLRGVRQENRDLKAEIERLRLEQVRFMDDAEQARRLQLLLGFKEQFISRTVAAQVIGASGSQQSQSVFLDKGSREGIAPDMAVVTADGIVGKVLRVFGGRPLESSVSEVLLINDQTSGVGAILERSRTQGVIHGSPSGDVVLDNIMADEDVKPGDVVLSSGGDQIFPKGLPVGTVASVSRGKGAFLHIRVRPAANLTRLEEVLVITQKQEREPSLTEKSVRAADILSRRLPSVPDQPEGSTIPGAPGATTPGATKTPVAGSPGASGAQGPVSAASVNNATPKEAGQKPGQNPAAKPPQAPAAHTTSSPNPPRADLTHQTDKPE